MIKLRVFKPSGTVQYHEFSSYGYVALYLLNNSSGTYSSIELIKHNGEIIDGTRKITEFLESEIGLNQIKSERDKTIPDSTFTYMFKDRPVVPNTWLELHSDPLVSDIHISDGIWILINTKNHTFCYVYSDEASQFSNPFETFDAAKTAMNEYVKWLTGK